MKTCSKCGKKVDKFQKKSRRCQSCRTAALKDYVKRSGYDKKRYWANPQGERERHYKRKYGVDLKGYNAMFEAQNGSCAICLRPATKTLDIDHNHATGEVRGLLCTNCNRMLGHAGDIPSVLENAAIYLRKSLKRS